MNPDESKLRILAFGGVATRWKDVIESRVPGTEVICVSHRKDLTGAYDAVRCLLGWRFPEDIFDRLPNLEWVQSLSVGVDALVANQRIPPEVRITNTAGLYGDAMAEYVIWAMLTLFRRFHTVIRNQQKRRWQQVFGSTLAGRTVGIVGLGDVGSRVARHAAALQMRTLGFVKDEKQVQELSATVDAIKPVGSLIDAVHEVDALVLAAPLTAATAGLVNRELVTRMKSSAILVNVARAGLIEGSAVTDAIREGRIAGAAVDVFDKEPLRRWSPLWRLENMLVTPHTSGMTSEYKTRVADLLCENMVRFADGRPLRNEIDRSAEN